MNEMASTLLNFMWLMILIAFTIIVAIALVAVIVAAFNFLKGLFVKENK